MQDRNRVDDPHEQLRRVAFAALETQERFDALKRALATYPARELEGDLESSDAAMLRNELNQQIDGWVDFPFAGFSAVQVTLLRRMLVEERINVALSPWKESNSY
jgi:hypothetical protein